VLQISSYWREGTPIRLDLAPDIELPAALARAKATSRKLLANELAALVPSRLAEAWVQQDTDWQRPVAEASDKALARLAERLSRWKSPPPAPRATARRKSRSAEWTRETSRRRRWSRSSPGCTSLAKWWM
jgi:predicted flavoprotein YhiN